MTRFVARRLFAPALVIALAILVKGYVGPGDGFAAGIVAALAFVLQFVAFGERQVRRDLHTKYAPAVAVAGLLLALATTMVPVLRGMPLLTHEPAPNAPYIHLGSLELLTAFLFDVGVFLLVVGFTVTSFTLVARAQERDPR